MSQEPATYAIPTAPPDKAARFGFGIVSEEELKAAQEAQAAQDQALHAKAPMREVEGKATVEVDTAAVRRKKAEAKAAAEASQAAQATDNGGAK